jgi:excisionase family DNA binding protein
MRSHDLLSGQAVDLRELDDRGLAFVRDLERMARQGVSYFEVYRAAVGPGAPALAGRTRIDRRIVESPLYLVARDIATRVGVKQGLVLAPEHEGERAKAPADSSMMSVAQAAELIGISRAAVYKAIEKGAIKALRIGNVTVAERASVRAYRDARPHEEEAKPSRAATKRYRSPRRTHHHQAVAT